MSSEQVSEPAAQRLRWYMARARRMSGREVASRARDQARQVAWERHRVRAGDDAAAARETADLRSRPRPFPVTLGPDVAAAIPAAARARLIATADRLLDGRWETLGVERTDLVAPSWFLDPITGKHAPSDRYAFRIQHRSEAETGNVKQVWELSRHQHLTVLAAAFFVTGETRYAVRVDAALRSWWDENPFLSGIHWTSGIEIGLRLVAWVWIRRLLDSWPAVGELFEHNELAARQIWWHQRYLAGFPSEGTSANNHAIAESVGQLVAACAFPWFSESDQWSVDALHRFERELEHNTFASGVNRELASEYHGFVAELAYCAAIEADASGLDLARQTWTTLCRMTDSAAALLDASGRPPRQGDGDDAFALRVDGGDPCAAADRAGRWAPLLAVGAGEFGPLSWWPAFDHGVFSTVLGSLAPERRPQPPRDVAGRPVRRPDFFVDGGILLLRTAADLDEHRRPEIWCRGDLGPHGFLATAAHAHADALSLEVRHDGVDVLADPGTYCYHGEPEWRAYFRSTRGHNTVGLAGADQSGSGGPFLWVRPANTRIVAVERGDDGEVVAWCAEHDGYRALEPPAVHRRTVRLDRRGRRILVVDRVDTRGDHALVLYLHLGPTVDAALHASSAELSWRARGTRASLEGAAGSTATLELPAQLRWTVHRGETAPILGWYSPRFGVRTPSVTLVGEGNTAGATVELRTELGFHD